MKLVSADEVAAIVSGSTHNNNNNSGEFTECLIVDCRSITAFSCSHIESSVNANVPSIIARRHGGIVPAHSFLSNTAAHQKLFSGRCKFVVIYDETGQLLCGNNCDFPPTPADIIAKSFSCAMPGVDVCYLKGL